MKAREEIRENHKMRHNIWKKYLKIICSWILIFSICGLSLNVTEASGAGVEMERESQETVDFISDIENQETEPEILADDEQLSESEQIVESEKEPENPVEIEDSSDQITDLDAPEQMSVQSLEEELLAVAENGEEALSIIRKLISYIPQNNLEEAPLVPCNDPIDRLEDSLNEIIPDSPNRPYDMYEVIGAIIDNGEFLEIQRDYAKNIIVGFARFNGQSVGVVANQPKCYAGVLDCNASRKGARFVRFCDAFNIPIVSLVDVPGFLPGTGQEYNGVILHGAKLLYAYGEATVPKVTITLRKSYGGSHIVMSCKQLRGDMNYAWPTAEIAVMGGAGAVEVLYAREAKEQENPAQFLAEKEAEYTKLFANPYNAAKYGYIDDVIEPRNTRFRIIRALQQLQTKKLTNPAKKHGNIPL